MNESTKSAPRPSLAPELDAERPTTPSGEAASSISDPERMQLAGIASEMAALSNRAEHASVEVAAIEEQMHDLVDKLTATAGVTLTDAQADTSTDTDKHAPVGPASAE